MLVLKHAQRETDLGILLISVIFVTHRQRGMRLLEDFFKGPHQRLGEFGISLQGNRVDQFQASVRLACLCLGLVPKVERKGIANPRPLGGWNAPFE